MHRSARFNDSWRLEELPYLDTQPLVLIAIALIAIAVTMNARLDDGGQGQW